MAVSRQQNMSSNSITTTQTSGVEDVVVSMATRVGILLSGVAIQSLLAYALLPAGRGEFAVCILFATLVGVLFTPGADAGTQYFVMIKRINVSQGVVVSLAICLCGAAVAAALAIPLINSNVAFFQKAEPTSFYVALVLIPLAAFSNAVQHQLAGLRRFKVLALCSLVQTVANGLAVVCLVVVLKRGVDGALFAACVGNLTMILACLRDLRRNVDFEARVAGTIYARYGPKIRPEVLHRADWVGYRHTGRDPTSQYARRASRDRTLCRSQRPHDAPCDDLERGLRSSASPHCKR